MNHEILAQIRKEVIECMFAWGAIKLSPTNPFQWASGNFMPIYNDNRLLFGDPIGKDLVMHGLDLLIEEHAVRFNFVAGVATAGIPPSVLFGYHHGVNTGYVRDKPKAHGLRNRIEGISNKGFAGAQVLVIEDLVSFGGSSADAVQAVRDMGGVVEFCLSIFSYGFTEAMEVFAGSRDYNPKEGKRLTQPCTLVPLITYDDVINYAEKENTFLPAEIAMLREWREDPTQWQYAYGHTAV
jgi:orotate phosphoribosyltransferase